MKHFSAKKIITAIGIVSSLASFAQKAKTTITGTNSTVEIYTTSQTGNLRLSHTGTEKFSTFKQPLETQICVFVNPNKTFQSLLGIGAAITDASAEVFATLPKAEQDNFLRAYFSKKDGIGYSLLRTTIHSSDFSSASYTYVQEGDSALKSFSIEHDRQFKLPLIKKALAAADRKTTLYASPWSPPAFMKTNGSMLKGGKLKPEFRQAWANYYVKFINSYKKEGLNIWGLSVQNEPMATQTWESCIYSAEDERDFVRDYLGPTLKKAGLSNKKLIVWDHNRDLIVQRASVILDDKKAAAYVWGVGFHWYETWAGGEPMFDNIETVNQMYPGKNLIFTEGCVEKFDAAKYQYWPNAERYGRSMINDFNNGTVAWTDWNILLDENGGPNHVKNFCFSPVHADTKTGSLIFTPSYYYIGHFSKFIEPGAKRISSNASRSQLLTTSFKNPGGKIATVVMNNSDNTVTYYLWVNGNAATISIPSHSIQTVLH